MIKKRILSVLLAGGITAAALTGCGIQTQTSSAKQETTTTTRDSESIDVVDISKSVYHDDNVADIEILGIADYTDMKNIYEYKDESMKDKLFLVFSIDNYSGEELRIYSRDLAIDKTVVDTEGVMIIEPGAGVIDFIALPIDKLPVKDKKDIEFLTFMLSISDSQGAHIDDTDVKQYEFKSGIFIQEYLN